jgi:hypothetical protein
MNTKTTTPPAPLQREEHTISYAYPSSSSAARLGRGKTGCYVLEVGGKAQANDSYADAVVQAQAQGTAPSRWSMDHPLNARFLVEQEPVGLAAA